MVADDDSGVPAAEDRSINELTCVRTSDGRLSLHADIDMVVGEKVLAALDALSAPRSEPDGSRDSRPAGRRRADALETVFDLAARAGDGTVTAPKVQVALTIPTAAPSRSSLLFLGAVSESTAVALACDAVISAMTVDEETVPVDVGRERRLFTAAQRKALYQRDGCCVKCGAPASWTQAHHIVHWAAGGTTSLDNGCLLCPACHDDIHHGGWDIVLGTDRHPWLIPPSAVDRLRRPRPAYNRRTMALDDLPSAA
ncbi:HNH endonuclease [Gordonia soli]|uniref:HNH nuclease domain-containing protein n=1 Tax=Gordonia soli NBRC 108243 TaxID=1223545 RepID=M0QFV8_9ACTN|nr:HNH endonuclease signature motif containing protein [Gordonia soli]GAC67448.1 hypothetical protein GS4_08_00320 [Gordonia soli NBRC 108243]